MIIVKLKVGYETEDFNCATSEEFAEVTNLLIKHQKAFEVSYKGEDEADA